MVYYSGMQSTNRKGFPFSSVRQLPVRSALDACEFTLYLEYIVPHRMKNVKKKDGNFLPSFSLLCFFLKQFLNIPYELLAVPDEGNEECHRGQQDKGGREQPEPGPVFRLPRELAYGDGF